jgi:SAM-dependent methyltransferase
MSKRAYHVVKRAYLARQFGYSTAPQSSVMNVLGILLFLFPVRREDVDYQVRHLPAHTGGQLLDVGCGSGEWLSTMQAFGWRVRGLDFDQNAVALAAQHGVEVDSGSLEEQCYADDSYDAITLNHVIEHLPNPVLTLRECHRILKPEGRLMLYTPSTESVGHRVFKAYWRGLEPPRHLYLFNPKSIKTLLSQAGFNHMNVQTMNSHYILQQSLGLWSGCANRGPHFPPGLKAASHLATLLEQIILAIKPDMGECLAVTGRKT